MDFGKYPEWNPFIRKLRGKAEVGARLAALLQPPGTKALTFHPRVRVVLEETNRQVGELDRMLLEIPGQDPVVQRLRTAPGVGPVTAAAYLVADARAEWSIRKGAIWWLSGEIPARLFGQRAVRLRPCRGTCPSGPGLIDRLAAGQGLSVLRHF